MFSYIYKKYIKYLNKIRISNLRLLGADIGKDVKAFGRFTVYNHKNLKIGEKTAINEGVLINCRDKVYIGSNVMLSSYSQIHSGKLLPMPLPRIHTKEPIIIEDNVWIASGVVVSSGITIGKNSIVAANSVVLNDVEANSLYAGVPAKKIKSLEDI